MGWKLDTRLRNLNFLELKAAQTMKKGLIIVTVLILATLGTVTGVILIPNPLGGKIIAEAKAMGYIHYTPEEAIELAYERCSTCHHEDKVLKYCTRCGPPFIVVAHFMKRYVKLTNAKNEHLSLKQFTDAEIVAIAQVWNALVGNWEGDWPEKDLKNLLDGDEALISLLVTPVEQRQIESALKGKSAPGTYERYSLGKSD